MNGNPSGVELWNELWNDNDFLLPPSVPIHESTTDLEWDQFIDGIGIFQQSDHLLSMSEQTNFEMETVEAPAWNDQTANVDQGCSTTPNAPENNEVGDLVQQMVDQAKSPTDILNGLQLVGRDQLDTYQGPMLLMQDADLWRSFDACPNEMMITSSGISYLWISYI
jgi:hypothetical protein